jgi:hypothetical protein
MPPAVHGVPFAVFTTPTTLALSWFGFTQTLCTVTVISNGSILAVKEETYYSNSHALSIDLPASNNFVLTISLRDLAGTQVDQVFSVGSQSQAASSVGGASSGGNTGLALRSIDVAIENWQAF